jgi:hypothetical protein
MEPLQFFAWVVVHIGVPIFAPIALLPLLGIGRTFRSSATSVLHNAIKNGQLLWIAIAMSASCCYELAEYLENALPTARAFAWSCLGISIVIITISAVLVMLGAIDGLDENGELRSAKPSRIMVVSSLLTTASAVLFGGAHYLIHF